MTDPRWKTLLADAVDKHPRGRAGVADVIGYSRGAVSAALAGKYEAKADRIAQAVLDHYDKPDCILVGRVIERLHCRRVALIHEPAGGDARVRWLTCQTCPNKPQE